MQSAALPYRVDDEGRIEVLLVTSRTRRRWILPKGKVGIGMLPHRSAAREAMEEAGVVGIVEDVPLTEFKSAKHNAGGTSEAIMVRVFPLAVTSELQRWPEDHQRERRWLPLKRAIKFVEEPAIRNVLKKFAATRV
jgi:8-oxo-dGTP pyrophosphatase MutT (NUDIX family)